MALITPQDAIDRIVIKVTALFKKAFEELGNTEQAVQALDAALTSVSDLSDKENDKRVKKVLVEGTDFTTMKELYDQVQNQDFVSIKFLDKRFLFGSVFVRNSTFLVMWGMHHEGNSAFNPGTSRMGMFKIDNTFKFIDYAESSFNVGEIAKVKRWYEVTAKWQNYKFNDVDSYTWKDLTNDYYLSKGSGININNKFRVTFVRAGRTTIMEMDVAFSDPSAKLLTTSDVYLERIVGKTPAENYNHIYWVDRNNKIHYGYYNPVASAYTDIWTETVTKVEVLA